MELRLPELGEGITDATVVNVPVKQGQLVKAQDTVIEVEPDKAPMPIPAGADGTVSEVRVKPGDKIKVGAVIAVVGDGKPAASRSESPAKSQPAPEVSTAKPQAATGGARRELTLPNLGEGIEGGVVVAVHVKPGDAVVSGQELFTIETEKASMPLPADADGKVEEVRVKQGDKVSVGSVLAVLSGDKPAAASRPTNSQPAPAPTKPQPAPPA